MIGDPDIFVAILARGAGHLLDGVRAVAGCGVGVKLAANIFHRYQDRKIALCRPLHLIVSFAEFRLDERQTELAVESFSVGKGPFVPARSRCP